MDGAVAEIQQQSIGNAGGKRVLLAGGGESRWIFSLGVFYGEGKGVAVNFSKAAR